MKTRRWICAAALLVAAGCATTQERTRAPGPKGAPLTPEAQAMMDRALRQEDASGFVVDLAAVEAVGLGRPMETLKRTAQLVRMLAPWFAAEEDDAELQQFVGRVMVASSILRKWTEWPDVRGLALSVPDVAEAAQSGEAPVSRAVVVLAVAQTQDANRKLLEGVLALGRAAANEHGKEMRFELRGMDACLVEASGPPFCLRPGNGYVLMGSPEAMNAYQSQGSAGAPSNASPSAGAAAGDFTLLKARISLRQQGRADLVVHGCDALTVAASVESPSPVLTAEAEQAVQQFLRTYDERKETQRRLIEQALRTMQAELAADPHAPAEMKQIAATLTPEKVLDPHGWWQQMRASIKSERAGQRYAVTLTIPAAAVEQLHHLIEDGGGTSAASLGVLAAIAVPSLVKFQCRSKQAEAQAQLKAIYSAQKAYAARQQRYGRNFKEIGFEPIGETRYTYCMGPNCLACTASGCRAAPLTENPCAGMSGVGKTIADGFQVCAFGNLDSDPGLDTWIIDDRGNLEQGENDCE